MSNDTSSSTETTATTLTQPAKRTELSTSELHQMIVNENGIDDLYNFIVNEIDDLYNFVDYGDPSKNFKFEGGTKVHAPNSTYTGALCGAAKDKDLRLTEADITCRNCQRMKKLFALAAEQNTEAAAA